MKVVWSTIHNAGCKPHCQLRTQNLNKYCTLALHWLYSYVCAAVLTSGDNFALSDTHCGWDELERQYFMLGSWTAFWE